jgi:hypothetical protein
MSHKIQQVIKENKTRCGPEDLYMAGSEAN